MLGEDRIFNEGVSGLVSLGYIRWRCIDIDTIGEVDYAM